MSKQNKKKPGYRTIHTVNGTQYVYECVSTYDKVKKESFNKQVCIGKQSPDGKFIPNARYREIHNLAPTGEKIAVSSKVIGTTAVLSSIADTSGLARCLTLSFGKQRGAQLLAFAEYLLVRGNALSHFSAWASSQKLPLGAVALSSQETSKFLSSMQVDEMEKFYGRWAQNFTDGDTICMDLTSVSSYSAGNELVKYGYNRDKERLEQVNILGLFSASKMLPVAVRMLPGNISDVTTLVKELVHFSHLGLADPMLMMDKGFDSEENRNGLLDKRIKFLMMSDSRSNLLKGLAEKHRDTMRVPSKMFFYQEDRYYATTELLSLGIGGNRRCYAYIFYCSRLAESRLDRFNEKLNAYYDQLVGGDDIAEVPPAFRAYFTVKETPKRGRAVILDEEAAVAKERSFSPMFIILSNVKMEAAAALKLYRERDSVEKFFDDMKNALDMKRLRVHSSGNAKARLFMQYIASILLYSCRNNLGLYESTNNSLRNILEDLSGICEVRHSDRYGTLITESTKKQRELVNQLAPNSISWLQN